MSFKKPFWPRVSPHFLACRRGVRAAALEYAVAVGLSGGADSLALMAALVAEGHEVLALCVDHGLQDGSRAQAERAAEQARKLGARARVLDVEAGATGQKSMEAAARVARYRALAAACAAEELEVAVAHTADDQAETLLLGALRGRVAGMSERSEVEGARVVRPLLGVRRADTEGACAELGLSAWQDPQNADTNFRRVALRREVIPQLNHIIGGDAVPALAQAASDAALDDAALHTPPTTDCAALAAMAEPRRRRAIAAWLVGEGVEVTRKGVGDVGKLCTHWHGQGPVAVRSARQVGQRLEVARIGGKLALLSGH
ncbi:MULTISPECIES: tRNA lysidine(34) synthetase TilS [Corynebacterium]|uniref:tRNA lysidine(34) synthetase TilS n=1 Tax=Corynebacterium TaxID=1716 RepID=UPI0021A5B19B|nr:MULTISPECIES: tRNA lysidine(34) synthetase TilS [Corynebacterium]MCT1427700.1 tRNA lysidine(34) synthetase TilS [Corynebacterium sp. p3-SID1241]WKE58721.1 tRNA lysidine(34) synthetase TilS [Corynebacterium tuberculostearicum]